MGMIWTLLHFNEILTSCEREILTEEQNCGGKLKYPRRKHTHMHAENMQTSHRKAPASKFDPKTMLLWGNSANHCVTLLPQPSLFFMQDIFRNSL